MQDVFVRKLSLEVQIEPTANNVDKLAAEIVAEQLNKKKNSVFVFPTGSTPLGMYQNLISLFQKKQIDFEKARIFNLDEYFPLKREHPSSYYYYMKKNLIDQVNILPENWHIPNGEANDPEAEAKRYEDEIEQVGSFDLAVLGIGPGTTCHIGFNEPPSSLDSLVHYVSLSDQTLKANSVYFSHSEDIPQGALTMGIADIFRAKKILLLAKGEHKAAGVKISLEGPISEKAPASFLRLHPNVTFLLDRAAARDLQVLERI